MRVDQYGKPGMMMRRLGFGAPSPSPSFYHDHRHGIGNARAIKDSRLSVAIIQSIGKVCACASIAPSVVACRRASVNTLLVPDADEEDRESEPTLQEIVNVKLIESGEKERLKELLRERLIECGWRDELKAQCRAFTRKKGRGNITVDELVRTMTPKGRAMVPDNVKAELLQRIRTFLVTVPS